MIKDGTSPQGKRQPAVVPTGVKSEGELGRVQAGFGLAILLLPQPVAWEGSKGRNRRRPSNPGITQVPTLL